MSKAKKRMREQALQNQNLAMPEISQNNIDSTVTEQTQIDKLM